MGEHPLSYTEILKTPIRDLYVLQDINHEIGEMKKKMLEDAEGSES